MAPGFLRAGLGALARRQRIEHGVEAFGGQILVIVVVDLDHRRRGAIAHAFHFGEGPEAVFRDMAFLHPPLLAGFEQSVRPAQHAGRRSADLDVEFTHRLHIVHEVKRRDFEHADHRHVEIVGDIFDHRQRQPTLGIGFFADLPLGEVEKRHHCRFLSTLGIARNRLVRLGAVGVGKLETAPALAQLGSVGCGGTISHYMLTH